MRLSLFAGPHAHMIPTQEPVHQPALRFSLLILCLVLFAGFVLPAGHSQVQQGLGALDGIVTDSSKAAITGAHVVLSNASIGYRKEVETTATGRFSFSPLTVGGGYALEVSAKGFSSESVKNLETSVGTVITQNVTLTVGSETTVVEVQAVSAEQVQVDTSSVSQVIDSTVWQDSPLEARSQNNFVGLTAGAAPDSGTGRGFAINGARTGAGNFLLDGFDNNDQGLGGASSEGNGASGGAVTTVSPDAIEEFRVISSTPPAEYGRAGGFATDTVLKSGTNHLHGTAFEYNRNQAITANNWFSDSNGLQDHLVRNQFGGSLGGPIYRDKTFFYGTVEFQRIRQGSPEAGIVTVTPDFLNFVKSGAFETFMENTVCPANTATDANPAGTACPGVLARSATLGPTFSALLAAEPSAFPLATSPVPNGNVGQGLYTTGIVFPVQIYGQTAVSVVSPTNQNRGSLKLDHKLTEHDQLSFTYLVDLNNTSNNHGGGDSLPGVAYEQVGGAQLFGATYIHTFSPTVVNTFKASYLRHVSNFDAPGTAGVPSIFAADSLYVGFGATARFPQLFTENQFGYEDSITKTLGRHSIKAGFGFKRTRNGSSFYNDVNGTVVPWSVEGLLTDGQSDGDLDNYLNGGVAYGALYEANASLNPSTGLAPDPYRGYRANEFSAYAQDDFKISAKLTVNYGVRWEYFGPPHNFQPGVDSNVYFGSATTPTPTGNPYLPQNALLAGEQGASFQLAESNGRSTIWNRDTNNFAPRLGFALDTFGDQKFVIRGGFGVGYDRLYNNVYENIRFNAPFFVDNSQGAFTSGNSITEAQRAAVFTLPFAANTLLAGAGASVPRHVTQNLVTAYYEQAHLGFETNVVHGYVLEANYIGTWGRKLVGLQNINTFAGRVACPIVTTPYAEGSACYEASANHLGFSSARPSSAFASDNFRSNNFNSNYNGGQVSLRKGYANGLQLLANYTYSKSLDEVSDVFTIKGGTGGGATDPYNPGYDYGPSDFDVRHLFSLTANYVTHSATHKLLLAGWGVSPILSLQSGATFTPYDGSSLYSPNKDGLTGTQRAVYTGTGNIKNAIQHGVSPANGYLAVGSFGGYTCPATVTFCDVPIGRNSLTGPRLENLDLAVSKHLEFTEKYHVTFQAAFFDVFNHPEFGTPVANTNAGNFGESTSAINRGGQLSGRFDF